MICNKTKCIANIDCICYVDKCKGEITIKEPKAKKHNTKEKAKIAYENIAKIFEEDFQND